MTERDYNLHLKGLLAERSLLIRLAALITAVLAGTCLSIPLVLCISQLAGGDAELPAWAIQATQFVSALCMFLFPALGAAWLCSRRPAQLLHLGGWPGLRTLALIAVATLALCPLISLAGHFNQQMQLPSALAPLEEMMRRMEDQAADLLDAMFFHKNLPTFLINLTVIAIVAAIAEESLFRGALTGILEKHVRNPHVLVWIVAFVFSFIHFQFYGFLPRLFLGAYLGYLFLRTGNLWAPVFAHFFNNALAVVGMSFSSLQDQILFTDELKPDEERWMAIALIPSLMLFYFCMKGVKQLTIR